jgi:hypothetical protein
LKKSKAAWIVAAVDFAGCRKTISAQKNFDGLHVPDKPSLSGYLAHLVSLMQPNKPDRLNEQERLANLFQLPVSGTGNSDSAAQYTATHRLSLGSAGCSEATLVPRNADGGSAMARTASRVRHV